jgi:diaminopimelate decarboxylase
MTQTAKYGIPNSELRQMLERSPQLQHVDFVGVHMHMGRHSKRADVWQALIASFVERIATIRAHLGGEWAPSIVSFGGGMAADADLESSVTVTDYETPKASEYAEFITSAWRAEMEKAHFDPRGITIEIEPGRALFNDAGIHLARVHNVKHETENLERRWVETDTSECFLSVGSLNLTSPFPYRVANKADAEASWTADIAGITCNYECLAEQVPLPEVEVGDVIAFLNTGSYIEVYGCNFNALPRPGVLLVSGDQADLIKRAESLDEVFARDIVPDRLGG